jgi:hypothetical protein
LLQRTCSGISKGGERCRQAALRDESFCFWHDPDHAEAADQARNLGGQRRRREGTLQGAYDFDGLASVADIRRLLAIAVMDALGLENSIARVRALIAASLGAAKLLEVGEMEERLRSLEAALSGRTSANPRRR